MEYSFNVCFNVFISSCANSNIYQFWITFDWLICLLIGSYFLPVCTPSNFWSDARHCEFYFVWCWIFFYSYKYSWAFFWNAVKLSILQNCLILLGLYNYVRPEHSSTKSKVNYFLLLSKILLCTLPNSNLADGNGHCYRPWIISGHSYQ